MSSRATDANASAPAHARIEILESSASMSVPSAMPSRLVHHAEETEPLRDGARSTDRPAVPVGKLPEDRHRHHRPIPAVTRWARMAPRGRERSGATEAGAAAWDKAKHPDVVAVLARAAGKPDAGPFREEFGEASGGSLRKAARPTIS